MYSKILFFIPSIFADILKNKETLCNKVADNNAFRSAIGKLDESDQRIAEFCSIPSFSRTLGAGNGSSSIVFNLEDVDGYACWCFIKGEVGQSQPIGNTDKHCFRLHMGYKCIDMDSRDLGIECDSKETSYNVSWLYKRRYTGMYEWVYNCSDNNDFCSEKACIVESHFIKGLVSMDMTNWEGYELDMKHSNGVFDYEGECPTTGGPPPEKECCGEYPFRYPYNTMGGFMQCCANGRPSFVC